MNKISVMRLSDKAILPTRGHADDAGLDLYCAGETRLLPGMANVIKTDVAVEIPQGFVGLVRDRSSISKSELKVTAGVVDAGYTGSVDVVMLNLAGRLITLPAGTKIAQLLILPCATPQVVEVTSLAKTARGDKGFGSTDV